MNRNTIGSTALAVPPISFDRSVAGGPDDFVETAAALGECECKGQLEALRRVPEKTGD